MPDLPLARFDGAAAWARLAPEQQAEIGAIALELVCTWSGQDASDPAQHLAAPSPAMRALETCDVEINDKLQLAVERACPGAFDADPPPIPSLLGQVCRRCGCSENDCCEFGCAWIEPDLCTSCVAIA